ncbi:hypothetical protein Q4506_17285 [Colwellia sp. 4_MG-2023]|uniref:hypothetical protein n=1 Tax=unclassified Colwellia TaxID=196834 RepID=UPI0026E319A9|nr:MULTISPECIES: hypothetical protein [unclassified Colwellia]MDO6508764.1 hypothetical protein [Colwellia sp. 5_MG-2023]MDO6557429.1 hypothetical protein [Colwellia sp. 4_MG-2023]
MKKTRLFVSMIIVQRYNSGAAWVFAHVAYNIVVNSGFDTKKCWPSNVKNFCGIGVDSYKKYLKTFVDDKILIKRESIYTFNSEEIVFRDVFASYYKTFKKLQIDNSISALIEVNPHSTDAEKMKGKGAFHQRLVVTIEAYVLNIVAQSVAFKKSMTKFTAYSFKWLSIEFGCDWRTIRAVIKTISSIRLTFDLKHKKNEKGFTLNLRKKYLMKIADQIQIFDLKVERYKKKNKELLNNHTNSHIKKSARS